MGDQAIENVVTMHMFKNLETTFESRINDLSFKFNTKYQEMNVEIIKLREEVDCLKQENKCLKTQKEKKPKVATKQKKEIKVKNELKYV
mmetsp:Transcript_17305/g.15275  ORF Transcript_17305/g.15275 Transcript_17305/m.15275 type:complete len:89 (+) Transcript_17305:22-288(+)